jgi:hypothetical protein
MSQFASIDIPRPLNWQDFERHCRVLFECIFDDPQTASHGSPGQRQNGVDIFGRREAGQGRLVGVQCKQKFDSRVTPRELREEVEKAKNFVPPLDEFILVTTANDDEHIQQTARELEQEFAALGRRISIAVWGWKRLAEEISSFPRALKTFHPDYSPFTDEILKHITSLREELIGSRGSTAELQAQIEPGQTVFDRVKLDRFAGREWLLREVDNFLAENDRGYFLIEAAAGLGKTTFMAHLASSRSYPRHFIELTPGLSGIEPALRNLAAQIVVHVGHELDRAWARRILTLPSFQPHNFSALLRDAASSERKLVLVIDGLDEAGRPEGQNPLGLPQDLPKGVFIIASMRPGHLISGRPRRFCTIDPRGEDNIGDIRQFLRATIRQPAFASLIADTLDSRNADRFVSLLSAKSKGIWIYIYYVIEEFERGERPISDLNSLPEGLDDYYLQWVRRWREYDEQAWDRERLPMLAMLAVIREPMKFDTVCQILGISPTDQLRRLLDGAWRSFVQAIEVPSGRAYTPYHASFAQFFYVDRTEQMEQSKRQLLDELRSAVGRAHDTICDFFLANWGSLAGGLPGLGVTSSREICGGYGLRNVVAHLLIRGRTAEAHELLLREVADLTGNPINAWYDARSSSGDVAGFSDDVRLVLYSLYYRMQGRIDQPHYAFFHALASVEKADELVAPGDEFGFGLAFLCGLMLSSVGSLASSTPAELLPILVRSGTWTLRQATAFARQKTSEFDRALSLASLSTVAGTGQDDLLSEAVQNALDSSGQENSTVALAKIAKYLTGPRATAAASFVLRDAVELPFRVIVTCLNEVAPLLTDRQRDSMQRLLMKKHRREYQGDRWEPFGFYRSLAWLTGEARTYVISVLHSRLLGPSVTIMKLPILRAALPLLREKEQREVLANTQVADWLAENELPLSAVVAVELWTIVSTSENGEGVNAALLNLVPSLSAGDASRILLEKSSAAGGGSSTKDEITILSALRQQAAAGQTKDGLQHDKLLREILEKAEAAEAPWKRKNLLDQIISELDMDHPPDSQLTRQILAAFQNLDDAPQASLAVATYSDGLSPQRLRQLSQNALDTILANDDSFDLVDADHAVATMVRIAIHLPRQTRRRHLERILDLQYRGHIPSDLLVGIGLLAASLPKKDAANAWDAIMETMTNEEVPSDISFVQSVFQLASSFPATHIPQLLDFIEGKDDQQTKSLALWALCPFLKGPLAKRAREIASRMETDNAGLLSRAATAAKSGDAEYISEVEGLLRAADEHDPFLTVSIACLIPVFSEGTRSEWTGVLQTRLETLVEDYRFAIAAHVQLALGAHERSERDKHWHKVFVTAAREPESAHFVRWLATLGLGTFTVSHELESVNALTLAVATVSRWQGFELLEAFQPVVRSVGRQKLQSSIRHAVETVQRWWP